jgi:hypothetical protein
MPSERTGYAPWSLTREAGVLSATVDGTIKVPQNVQPTINTGFVDEKGNWVGIKSDDNEFFAFTKHVAVASTGETLSPATSTISSLDMSGFKSIFLAIKPSRGGDYKITAVMGPDTESFANLQPVDAAALLKGSNSLQGQGDDFNSLLSDNAQGLTVNVWNILMINNSLQGQRNLQFKITNNSGGSSDIEVAFMRLV